MSRSWGFRILAVIFLTGFFRLGFAAVTQPEPCKSPLRPLEIYECLLKRQMDVLVAEQDIEVAKANISLAEQRPNPDLEFESAQGDKLGDRTLNVSGQVLHNMEIGGKRRARVEFAREEVSLVSLRHEMLKEDVVAKAVLAMIQLRQIQVEKKILEGSKNSWNSIRRQLRERMALTPEQRASLTVFDLSYSEVELQLSQLNAQEIDLHAWVDAATRAQIPWEKVQLPELKDNWPKLSETPGIDQSVRYRMAAAEGGVATKALEVQRSLAWPDVKLGPVLSYQREGPVTDLQVGVRVSFPIPFFHRNEGGRRKAQEGIVRSEINQSYMKEFMTIQRKHELRRYEASLEALKKTNHIAQVQSEFQRIENLFRRGVLQSSLVIEAHRQMIETTRGLHRQELNALESLLAVSRMDGKIVEVSQWFLN